jgi:hypothetical protein
VKPVRDGIDTYDGTLYFEEIAQEKDVSIIGEIAKRMKADGIVPIKINWVDLLSGFLAKQASNAISMHLLYYGRL